MLRDLAVSVDSHAILQVTEHMIMPVTRPNSGKRQDVQKLDIIDRNVLAGKFFLLRKKYSKRECHRNETGDESSHKWSSTPPSSRLLPRCRRPLFPLVRSDPCTKCTHTGKISPRHRSGGLYQGNCVAFRLLQFAQGKFNPLRPQRIVRVSLCFTTRVQGQDVAAKQLLDVDFTCL